MLYIKALAIPSNPVGSKTEATPINPFAQSILLKSLLHSLTKS
jgi:hypothetical protein